MRKKPESFPKFNDDQLSLGLDRVAQMYERISMNLFFRMIQRIKQRGAYDLAENPYLWHLEKLNDMGLLNRENIDYVIKETGISKKLLYEVIENEGLKVYENTHDQLAESQGSKALQINGVKSSLESYANQTFLDLDNLVNETLLTRNASQNGASLVYRGMLQDIVGEVTTGTKTTDRAVADVVMAAIGKGIPSNFRDKAGRRWAIDTYARTAITSTKYRVYNDMRKKASDEFGIDTYYYSVKPAARPACAPIQGKLVTYGAGFESEEGYVESLDDHGYGSPAGCLGVNCHHFLTPYVIGVNSLPNEKVPSQEEAVENGKLQAKQRAYEREIRANKRKLEAAKRLDNEELTDFYKDKVRSNQQRLRTLVNDTDFLTRDYNREKIYF